MIICRQSIVFFFFNDTATTEIYTLSLHDALPILSQGLQTRCPRTPQTSHCSCSQRCPTMRARSQPSRTLPLRSEEHTSELQSRQYLVCRLLLEKKKHKMSSHTNININVSNVCVCV